MLRVLEVVHTSRLELIVRYGNAGFGLEIESKIHVWNELNKLPNHTNDTIQHPFLLIKRTTKDLSFSISYPDPAKILVVSEDFGSTFSQLGGF